MIMGKHLSCSATRTIARCHGASRAFTLAESAIVMVLVGIVLGAIWTQTAAVQRQNLLNRAVDQIREAADATRGTYANQNPAATPTIAPVLHPWSTDLTSGSLTITFPSRPLRAFNITLTGLQPEICIGLVASNSFLGPNVGSAFAGTPPAPPVPTALPPNETRAQGGDPTNVFLGAGTGTSAAWTDVTNLTLTDVIAASPGCTSISFFYVM